MAANSKYDEMLVSKVDDDTVLVTSPEMDWAERYTETMLRSALESFSYEHQSSVIPSDSTTSQEVTLDWVDQMAQDLNSNHDNLITVNSILLQKILSDAYVGRTFESVVSNINTSYSLSYGENELDESCIDELNEVKTEIDYLNYCINIKKLINDVVSKTYAEGNCPLVFRMAKGQAPVIDIYPLKICYPSDYLYGGMSILEFNVNDLKDTLRKTYAKTKKNKAIYFENVEKEIQGNYPKEIYDAYKAGDKLVRIDPRYGACVKVNDVGRKFGVSPLFRAMKPLIVLEQIEEADVSDSKARGKKIIAQIMREEVLGPDGTRKGLEFMAYAHKNTYNSLRSSGSSSIALVTAPPHVESIAYVTPKTAYDDALNQQKLYTQKLLIALGIGFTDTDATVGAGQVSVKMLLKTINSICRSLEGVLNRFYMTYVEDMGHDLKFAPTIHIIESEQMEMELRKELAAFLYGTLNTSLETALDIVGMDISEELVKRQHENEEGFSEIFYPRPTAYTNSKGDMNPDGTENNPEGGRPTEDNPETEDKQQYDKQYTKDVR